MRPVDEHTLAELCELAGNERALAELEAAGESCGWCSEPVRLKSVVRRVDPGTGEIAEQHGTYYKACGTRRATRCPSCAERYRRDARTIVLTGLQGGRGVPEQVAERPAMFATLTAPSFGAVHRCGRKGERRLVCHGGVDRRCPHGRVVSCNEVHGEGDSRVGEALCPDCYDYEGAVLWNALAPELWRRLTIYARRYLGRAVGMSERELRERCRLSFVKVAEYQRRGLVHLHVVARLDPVGSDELPVGLDEAALISAFVTAARSVAVALPGRAIELARFGGQLDAKPLATGAARIAGGVAGYLAKYSIKSSDDSGALDRRIASRSQLGRRALGEHHRRLATAAWDAGACADGDVHGLRRNAHALGFRGHWMTKSRTWSVTFQFLRGERLAWRTARDELASDVLSRSWAFEARGWQTSGAETVAATRQCEIAEARRQRLLDVLTEQGRQVAS